MSTNMQDQEPRVTNLLLMGNRLADAVEADIAALERGAFQELRTTDPEIARISALYAREVANVKAAGGLKSLPPTLIEKLKESSARLTHGLTRHGSLVAVMRQATEGLVKAVAEEVDKSRNHSRTYTAKPGEKRTPASALIYNKSV